ncbi:MAG: ABC transporter permease [Prevotellaceae bacterium]|jgi:ABC-type antimicrobial peptide transport system permease subunit|nr:ABC transporter permease [Prevotellaceae bacterium]
MKKISQYLRSAFYNILQNKLYALFCIAGTALAFIFITLILQLIRISTGNYPPMTNAGRIIRLEYFRDTEGNGVGGIRSNEVNAFLELLKDFEYISLCHGPNGVNTLANGHLRVSAAGFVNADFWKIFDFELLYGKLFSEEDCVNRKTIAVITENTSRSFFNTPNGVGKKISFQQREYEVIGIVKDASIFSSPTSISTIWVPYVFNRFLAGNGDIYTVDIFAPPTMTMDEAKEKTAKAVQQHFENKNVKVDFPAQNIRTISPPLDVSDLEYFGVAALLLFMLIPAINILSLSVANTGNRAEEIAVRKTFGASRASSFFLIIAENLMLTIVGAIIGVALAAPVIKIIQENIMQGSAMENLSLLSGVDYRVIFAGVLPAAIVFSLMSGGIPAYLIAKRPIAQVLKGGSK